MSSSLSLSLIPHASFQSKENTLDMLLKALNFVVCKLMVFVGIFLSFQDNKLRHLPPSIGLMNAIENLYLNNNMLLDVPDEMGDAISLCLVNLRGNKKLRV